MDKISQISTDTGRVNPETGLTPLQEQTAIMLASGERISNVAEKVGISRATIYQWQDIITFRCFYNQKSKEAQEYLKDSLLTLCDDAIKAVKETLNSENESIRLKSATFLIEKILGQEILEVNPYNEIKKECSGGYVSEVNFYDEDAYRKRLAELKLSPEEKD